LYGAAVRTLSSRSSKWPVLSLLLALVLVPWLFLAFSGFPPSTKTNTTKFQFDPETMDEKQADDDFFILCRKKDEVRTLLTQFLNEGGHQWLR